MMATPENMMAETSCQTLSEREDRAQCEHRSDPITHASQSMFLAACLSISLHPPPGTTPADTSLRREDSPPTDAPCSSSLSMQTGLAGEAEPKSPAPKQRREVTLPGGWHRAVGPHKMHHPVTHETRSSSSSMQPLWFPAPAGRQELKGLRLIYSGRKQSSSGPTAPKKPLQGAVTLVQQQSWCQQPELSGMLWPRALRQPSSKVVQYLT